MIRLVPRAFSTCAESQVWAKKDILNEAAEEFSGTEEFITTAEEIRTFWSCLQASLSVEWKILV